MKVILLTEIKNLGKANQVIEVKDGYAKNYLFVKKLAVPATTTALSTNQKNVENENQANIEKIKHFQALKNQLENLKPEFKLLSHKDKVSNAISAKQICAYLLEHYQVEIDKHKFVDFKPIKKIGSTNVSIRLYGNIIANLTVVVNAA